MTTTDLPAPPPPLRAQCRGEQHGVRQAGGWATSRAQQRPPPALPCQHFVPRPASLSLRPPPSPCGVQRKLPNPFHILPIPSSPSLTAWGSAGAAQPLSHPAYPCVPLPHRVGFSGCCPPAISMSCGVQWPPQKMGAVLEREGRWSLVDGLLGWVRVGQGVVAGGRLVEL